MGQSGYSPPPVQANSAQDHKSSEAVHVERAILEAVLDGIVTVDAAGMIVDFNPAAERTFGYARCDAIGQPLVHLVFAPLRRDRVHRHLARLAAGEQRLLNRRLALRMTRADGSEFPVEITITRVPTDGPPVFTSVIRDLTEQHRAQLAFERLQRQHELILLASREGIVGVDAVGNATFVNPAAAHMLGYAVDELIGRPMHDLVHHKHPDGTSLAREACPLQAGVTGGRSQRTDDAVFIRKDGTSFPIEAVTTPVHESGAIVGGVVVFRDITRRREGQRRLEHQACHNSITGLFNRVRVHAEIQKLASTPNRSHGAVLVLDLDGFREVNVTFGHEFGDRVLKAIGQRLASVVDDRAVLGHLADDEFVVVLPDADAAQACAVADEVLVALQRALDLDRVSLEVSGSIGIALFPDHGQDADALLRAADRAVYAGKDDHRGYALFTPEHDQRGEQRLALIPELRRAIDNEELTLHYQPQLDARTGELLGVEALVRWPHPERGLLAPGEIVSLAEKTRLIRPLTRLVLTQALRQCAAWRATGLDCTVSVNVSARDLQDHQLPDLVGDLLASTGVPAERVRVEITESGLMGDQIRARQTLARLRGIGVQIAVDDFGTGQSSLAYLKDLPVDELKIDRSFVKDIATDDGARALVRGVIDLADGLRLRVVAEGVEDHETWEILTALGCDVVQGYYFGSPMPASELADWLRTLSNWRTAEEQRDRFEIALTRRANERGARLNAEDAYIVRKRTEWALKESNERLRLALDAAGMATWDWDLVLDTINWSAGAGTLFGDDMVINARTRDGFVERIYADDRAVFDAAVADALRADELRVQYRITGADGRLRWLACTGRVQRDPTGRAVRILGTHRDITVGKQAEQQRQALAQAEKLRALGQMASGIAHDLNQSLALIAGYGDLAHRAVSASPIDTELLDEALPIIARAARDGGETVRQLLTFARGGAEGQAETLDLGSVLREVAQLTAPRWRDASQAAGHPISLQVDVVGETTLVAWPASLREALTNLIFNAVDALPDGGTIRLSARREPTAVIVEVADSGCGMTEEVQSRIFEPFFTTKGERGTGLGLAQVFGAVRQHDGDIRVESAPGKGTTFRLALPAAPATTPAHDRADEAARPSGPLDVLAVDDEPAMGKMIARVLRPRGHRVVTATSGEEAIEQLKGQSFDVLISDIGMGPGMNGWDLVERVRQFWPRMRVIVATGWGAAIDPAEAQDRGADVVIAKPYAPDELARVLTA